MNTPTRRGRGIVIGEFDKPRWSWESNDSDIRVGYMGMRGRISLSELTAHMREVAPYASLDDIDVNFATVKWTRPATTEELAQREDAIRRQRARMERWERETLIRLVAKYGVPQ